jgi:hypothetical protein
VCYDWLDLNLGHGARQCQPVLARISDCQTQPESQPSTPANPELPRSPPQSPQETERIQAQVHYRSSAKNLNLTVEGEQLHNDLAKQKKSCSSDFINIETEIGAVKKIPEKPKKRDTRTAMFLEALDQGGAENNDTGFDETEKEKNTRTAMFPEVLDQGGAEMSLLAHFWCPNGAQEIPPGQTSPGRYFEAPFWRPKGSKYCQTLPNSGSETAISTQQLWKKATSGSKKLIFGFFLKKQQKFSIIS